MPKRKDGSKQRDAQRGQRIKGRSFAGTSYASTEREQTLDREAVGRQGLDEAGEPVVTDAEIEARERDRGR